MTTKDYPPQSGPWTLKAPDGRFWIGMTPMAAVRAEMNERIPAAVQLARINAAIAEDKAEESAEIARLQAQVDALAVALERLSSEAAEGLNSCITRDSNGHAHWTSSFRGHIASARAALAAAGR